MHETIKTILKELLDAMGASYSSIQQNEIAGQVIFSVQTDDARALIGTHGDTAYSVDLLVKKILEKRVGGRAHTAADADHTAPTGGTDTSAASPGEHFLIDINDYRARQIKDLQTKALMMAERARSFEYDVELTPMSAYERLIIHTTLQGAPHVKTESQGEGRSRRVVIRYTADA